MRSGARARSSSELGEEEPTTRSARRARRHARRHDEAARGRGVPPPSDLSFGGQGFAGMPVADGTAVMELHRGLDAGRREARTTARRPRSSKAPRCSAARSRRRRADAPRRRRRRSPASSRRSTSSSTSSPAIALFVGGFLILNSFNMTVLQRMRELGMLRTLGATRGMVARTVARRGARGRRGRHAARPRARTGARATGWSPLMKGFGHAGRQAVVTSAPARRSSLVGHRAGGHARRRAVARPPRGAGRRRSAPCSGSQPGGAAARAVARLARGLALFLPGCLLGGKLLVGRPGSERRADRGRWASPRRWRCSSGWHWRRRS